MSGRTSVGQKDVVSVILCTYNRARLVQRAVRSVRRQSYAKWQLIIVDDGSTDNSPEILNSLPTRDSRITVVRQANAGPANSRNTGLGIAQGEYITFLDSDDEYRKEHLRSRVAYLKRRPEVSLLHGGLEIKGPRSRQFVADIERPGRMIHVSDCYAGGTFFMRRKIIDRGYRFAGIPYGEDYDFIRRLGRRYVVREVSHLNTYVYHCEAEDRVCDIYAGSNSSAGLTSSPESF